MRATTITKNFAICLPILLAVMSGAAMAQNVPSSDLLLPYFEVDAADPGGLTTLFAAGNSTEAPVAVLGTVYTNWGIPILEVRFTLQSREVRTVNLRDWFRTGGDAAHPLSAAERQHLAAAASGQRSPKDGLYYSSEIGPDLLVGYVTLRTQGNRPDALWGDWFNVDVAGNLARGDVLANIDRSTGCPGLCKRHLLRYLNGGGFDGGTEVIIWRATLGTPSPDPAAGPKMSADATAFNEPGQPIENRQLALLPVEKVLVSGLGLRESFGSLDVEAEDDTFIAVQHTSEGRYSVGLTTYCLPRKIQPGPGLEIVKFTNGQDANAAPGPSVPVGGPITWEYQVINTGNVTLSHLIVTDDKGVAVTCPKTTLASMESMTCTGHGVAQACQYTNLGTVTAQTPGGQTLNDSDPSHYFGTTHPGIKIETAVNGQDADTPTGPQIPVGSAMTFTSVVTNTGNVALTGVHVSDSSGLVLACPKTVLQPAESMTCTAGGTAQSGQFSSVGAATGTGACGQQVSDDDPVHYFGNQDPRLKIVKLTNGEDANVTPGPSIPLGSPITWEYRVTNTGNVTLSNLNVTDDKGVAVTCPKTTLVSLESMTCTGHGVAQACQYANIGTVTGRTPGGQTLTASDPSHYFGTTHPGIKIETAVDGQDADTPTGPQIPVGSAMTFTSVVTNTGNVALTGVHVSDSSGLVLSCPKTTLQPAESMTCTAVGNAQAGQFSSVGAAAGTGACGDQVSDDDPVHYFGLTGTQGCSHGYWKNHPDSWPATGYSTSQTVSSVFSQASLYPSIGSVTLLGSLSFQGGSDVTGAASNLIKQATGSVLNSAHAGIDFPWQTAQLISEVNAALASQNGNTLLNLAVALEHDNTLGCPLN